MLTTLVHSAAEMRNSFDEMKQFIREQDGAALEVGRQQHEKTQRMLNGPRPLPPSAPRSVRDSTEEVNNELPQKRRNAFRRALKGFSGRNSNDIARLEMMLNHLLDEMAELKAAQGLAPNPTQRVSTYQSHGLTSYENLRDGPQSGYEPEGNAGTNSTAGNSGYFSNSSLRQGSGGPNRRRASENRVSTVLEADEENETLEPHEQEVLDFENSEQLTTPTREKRHTSVPLATPPAAVAASQGIASNENTPQNDRHKKSKSSSSSFFPKFSRWSRTTASTTADNNRTPVRRTERASSQLSRSGSDLGNYDINDDSYDPQGDDRLRSNTSLARDERPVSPLVPSSVSEKPTYHAHRDSMNLQHPQPRVGPTARFQNHLESQVQDRSPLTPSSDQFGSNPVLARYSGGSAGNRYSGPSAAGAGTGNLSPISDRGYSESQATPPPPKPPKIRNDGPLIPPKVPLDEPKLGTYAERAVPQV